MVVLVTENGTRLGFTCAHEAMRAGWVPMVLWFEEAQAGWCNCLSHALLHAISPVVADAPRDATGRVVGVPPPQAQEAAATIARLVVTGFVEGLRAGCGTPTPPLLHPEAVAFQFTLAPMSFDGVLVPNLVATAWVRLVPEAPHSRPYTEALRATCEHTTDHGASADAASPEAHTAEEVQAASEPPPPPSTPAPASVPAAPKVPVLPAPEGFGGRFGLGAYNGKAS